MNNLFKLLRHLILTSTTQACSGHPTSSLSAVELIGTLMFGGFFRFDVNDPHNENNDRLIFSKGHASPLFYALWAVAGGFPIEEMQSLRVFGSRLEGHPTMEFPFTEAPTGSLGQGLSIGLGMALAAKYIDKLDYKTYVLLGDSEMAEGSVWETLGVASYYKTNNLIGILDVNRLGQSGETMLGHHVEIFEARIKSFGWETVVIDGHNSDEIIDAFQKAQIAKTSFMIIAKTVKGKGVSFIEDQNGWHGKALDKDQLKKALEELGAVDLKLRGDIKKPESKKSLGPEAKESTSREISRTQYNIGDQVATRKAYGNALVALVKEHPEIVVLDAETSNSTYSETVKKSYPDKFFEMYIAEQNMVGVAIGLARRGKIPCISTFAAFWTRAHDQIRMAQYADSHIIFVGSHAGVSIGSDGASQMGLEDISMMRSIHGSTVLYPSDAASTEALLQEAVKAKGPIYIRTTRAETPVLYDAQQKFTIGGSYILQSSTQDAVTLISAGIALHEALKAYEILQKEGVSVRVVDLYSIKPIDRETMHKAAKETKALITIEDHYPEGGIGEAVRSVFEQSSVPIISLAVKKMPRSGKPEELLNYEEISAKYIVERVKSFINL